MSRTRLAAWHYGSRLLLTVATLALGFVVTPLVLGYLGSERFGAYRAVVEWMGYLALLEIGIGDSLQPLLAKALAQHDDAATRNVLRVGVRAYGFVVLAQGASLAIFATVVPRLVPVSADHAPDLVQATLVAGLGLLLAPVAPFRVLAEASQRGYLVHALLGVQGIVTAGASLLLARAGWGITGQALAAVLGQLPFGLGLLVLGLARDPGLGPELVRGAVPRETWDELRRLNGPAFVLALAGRLGLLSDNLLVGLVLGPAAVTPFQLTQRLTSVAQVQLHGVAAATWAALAEIHARGDLPLFRERLLELTRLVSILGTAVLVPIAAWTPAFVRLWVGPEQFGGDLLTGAAALVALLHAVFSLWGWVFMTTGKASVVVPTALAVTVVNVGASVAFTWSVGLPGPVLGTLASFVVVNAWALPLQLTRTFGVKPLDLARAVLVPFALGVRYAALAWNLARTHEPAGWLELALEMAAFPPVFLAASAFVVMGREERARYLDRARAVLGQGGAA